MLEGASTLLGSSWHSVPPLPARGNLCVCPFSNEGVSRVDGLQATGKAELGCRFSAKCSWRGFKVGEGCGFEGVRVHPGLLKELPGKFFGALPEDPSRENRLALTSCDERWGLEFERAQKGGGANPLTALFWARGHSPTPCTWPVPGCCLTDTFYAFPPITAPSASLAASSAKMVSPFP